MADTISVIVMSPAEVVWEGEAKALSSRNKEGAFDILPNHANFMTLIRDTDVIVQLLDDTTTRTFSFEQAVLFFQNNTAKMYIHTPEALKDDEK